MGRIREFIKKRRRIELIVGGAVIFLIFNVALVETTSQSWFCNSCHIMNPYYSSWKTGTHKDIECVQCHIEPGAQSFLAAKLNGLGQVVDDVLHRTSAKPSASVSQLACTRSGCHDIENLKKKEIKNDVFKFRHDKHLGAKHLGVEISCGTCHSHVKGEKHFEVSTSVCITCHMLEKADGAPLPGEQTPSFLRLAVREYHPQAKDAGKSDDAPASPDAEKRPPLRCTTCHEPPSKEIEFRGIKVDHAQFLSYGAACESCHRGVTAPPQPIEDGRCLQCHNFGIEKSLEPREMHKVHTLGRHKIECFECHGSIQHGPKAQMMALEQLDCRRCHIDQHVVQRSAYFGVTSDTPAVDGAPAVNPMFMTHVDCNGCHIKPRALHAKPDSGAQVRAAAAEACDACHKPGLGAQMIPLWQRTTHEQYDQILALVTSGEGDAGADKSKLREARRLLDLVRVDSSWGVHNPQYTQKLLQQARELAGAARAPAGGKP